MKQNSKTTHAQFKNSVFSPIHFWTKLVSSALMSLVIKVFLLESCGGLSFMMQNLRFGLVQAGQSRRTYVKLLWLQQLRVDIFPSSIASHVNSLYNIHICIEGIRINRFYARGMIDNHIDTQYIGVYSMSERLHNIQIFCNLLPMTGFE